MTEEIMADKALKMSLREYENRCEIMTSELKRLEQDNKQLTQWLDEARKNADFWCDQCTCLEQENKELKDKITALEDKLQLRMASDKESDEFWDEVFSAEDYPFNKENAYKELKDYYFVLEQISNQAYNDALERYYDKIDDLEYNNNAYRSALEEIRTYLNTLSSIDSDFTNTETYLRIQDKINEVLDAK